MTEAWLQQEHPVKTLSEKIQGGLAITQHDLSLEDKFIRHPLRLFIIIVDPLIHCDLSVSIDLHGLAIYSGAKTVWVGDVDEQLIIVEGVDDKFDIGRFEHACGFVDPSCFFGLAQVDVFGLRLNCVFWLTKSVNSDFLH